MGYLNSIKCLSYFFLTMTPTSKQNLVSLLGTEIYRTDIKQLRIADEKSEQEMKNNRFMFHQIHSKQDAISRDDRLHGKCLLVMRSGINERADFETIKPVPERHFI